MSKFVGESEKNIRELFEPAIQEYRAQKENSSLHVIIFDEIDAICRQRGSSASSGTNVHDTMVN
jgi:vesicle-fusing ATPase